MTEGYCVKCKKKVEMKDPKESLTKSEDRYRGIFDQAAVGVALLKPDGTWLEVNNKLCDIVGYTEGELLTKTFQDITHPDDLQADLDFVNQLLNDEVKTYSTEKPTQTRPRPTHFLRNTS